MQVSNCIQFCLNLCREVIEIYKLLINRFGTNPFINNMLILLLIHGFLLVYLLDAHVLIARVPIEFKNAIP